MKKTAVFILVMSWNRWFKFKHLINNVSMSAQGRAQRLLVQSGLAG